MNTDLENLGIEPERYELNDAPAYHFEFARRDFFKGLSGGLLIVLALRSTSEAQESGGGRRGQSAPTDLGAWLHIDQDGLTTVYTGKVEVGQDIRTSLSQAVAEELRTPLANVRMIMGDTDLTPYDAGTFGSLTTRMMNPQLRKAAAVAREMLLDIAADSFHAERGALNISDGKVTETLSGKTMTFGQLTKGRKLARTITDNAPLTPAAQWIVSGRSAPKVSALAIVTGRQKFVSDMRRPEMLYGKVLRAPSYGATLVSCDLEAAGRIPGVTVVRDGEFVGVAAPSVEIAVGAIAAIKADWKPAPQVSSREIFGHLKATGEAGRADLNLGSVDNGMASAYRQLKASYHIPYIAHAPLEPRSAIAEWANERLTVWAGTQRPFGVRSELALAFRLSESAVHVIMPDSGAGYGGKHTGETAIEAARLAKAAGKPVRVVWTREEEFNWAYFRPAGVIEISSGIASDGKITAWEFHNYNSGTAGIRSNYEMPNQRIEFHNSASPLRQGSYRGLASTANHFARETHIDELARELKMDALEFRIRNLKDERLIAVFNTAAKAFGWGKPKAGANHGVGIAGGFEKGGYVANCVEIEVDRRAGRIRVLKVVTAFECGAIVNPEGLRNQVEGAIVQGLGGALFEAIEFENGKLLNGRFSKYRVPRFNDLPALETFLIDRKDLPPAGAGECPIVGIAPAIGNAVADATGIRLRALPLRLAADLAR